MIDKVSVVGLGKLGSSMAAIFAKSGFPTIGVDLDEHMVESVKAGVPPVDETGLADLMHRFKCNLTATKSYEDAINDSDATFVIVPTPSDENGGFSLDFAKSAFREIGKALVNKNGYHLIVLTSTVLPGGTEYGLLPVIEKASGKKLGQDFGLCYSPEFIALGSVIQDFLNPSFVLIGESDEKAGEILATFYQKVCENSPPIQRMNFINAELTKMSVNSFMTMKISFANMLSGICHNLPNSDVDIVTNAVSLFGGVGGKAMKGGLGYGGPCLPRDNVALAYLADKIGYATSLPSEVDKFNKSLVSQLWSISKPYITKKTKVALLGLSFKPQTGVTEKSQSLELLKNLSSVGANVTVFDPLIAENPGGIVQQNIKFSQSLTELVLSSELVFLMNPDPAFESLGDIILDNDLSLTLIDPWRVYKEKFESNTKIQYVPVGLGAVENRSISKLLALANN